MLRFHDKEGFRAIRGTLLNPISDTECALFKDGLVVAKKPGFEWIIQSIGPAPTLATDYSWDLAQIPSNDGLILPAFYDLHFHWVQDDVRDLPKVSLLEWLEKYTFPEEAKYASLEFAEQKAKHFWKRILQTGTIGGLCYSSIHQTALDAAMKYASKGFRIGNALMNMNCPDPLQQSPNESIASTAYGSSQYGDRYCISPRFAPTTLPEVMKAGAQIAKENGLFQQTHLCETHQEIDWVTSMYREKEGFEDIETYTEIYNRCGMLGPKTVMGHSIHLSPQEWDLIAATETAIASCPTSNAPVDQLGLGSGLFDFTQAEKQLESSGVRWALASDIGGGPFLSMLDVMDSFVQQNRAVDIPQATYTKALYRSTLAGAEILGFGKSKGNFAPGKSLDFIAFPRPFPAESDHTSEELIASIIGKAAKRNEFDSLPSTVVIEGKVVFSKQLQNTSSTT
ncbi:amidohydrolase family protein [Puniceicoccaceae bacterium K14]|nr:amidohydrolase family protein [Puniceicoccaceae bacterium K14]